MALYGWEPAPPPSPVTGGFSVYKPPRQPRSTFKRPRPKAPVRQHPFDPLAPTSDETLRQRALNISQEELAPILAQIRAAIEARSQAGQAAIKGYTGALAGLLAQGPGQTKASYDEAIGQQSQVNSELANRLGSYGQTQAAQTADKLSYAPASTQSNLAAGAANTATGAANANFGIGAADITKLISESAHGQEEGAKLPGIAALTGLQHSKDLERQLNDELASQLAEQSSKAQDTFAQIYLHYQDQEYQKALARQSGQFKSAQAEADARYRSQQIAFRKAELAWKQAKAKADRSEKAREANQRNTAAQQRIQTTRQGQQRTAAQRAADRRERAREANQRNATTRAGQKKGGTNPATGVPH